MKLHLPLSLLLAVMACFSQMESRAANRFLDGAVTIINASNFDAMKADLGELSAGMNVTANMTTAISTNLTMDIAGKTWDKEIKAGNYLGGNFTSKVSSTNLTFKAGTFTATIFGSGNYTVSSGTYEVGNTNITVEGGTFQGLLTLGGWSSASTGKKIEIESGNMKVTGGNFTGAGKGLYGLGRSGGSTKEHFKNINITIGANPVFSASNFIISGGGYEAGMVGTADHTKLILDGTTNADQFKTVTFKQWDEISVINSGVATIYKLENGSNASGQSFTKTGNGTLVIANALTTLSDGVILQEGVLRAGTEASLGNNGKLKVTGKNVRIEGPIEAYKNITLASGANLAVGLDASLISPSSLTTEGGAIITGNVSFRPDANVKLADLLQITGTLKFEGSTTINLADFKGGKLAADTNYELMRVGNLADFNASNLGLINYNLDGYVPTITGSSSGISFKLTLLKTSLNWAGTGKIWSTTSGADWSIPETGSAAIYVDGAGVTFGDLAPGRNSDIQITSTVAPAQITVNAETTNYTFSGSGSIIGSTSLDKKGAGTLVINTVNKYSGGTTVSGGTVISNNLSGLGSGNISVSGSGIVKIGGSGTLSNTVSLKDAGSKLFLIGKDHIKLSSAVSGAGSMTVAMDNQDATITVDGTKDYSGGTFIEKGTLSISSLNALGTGDITINGGKLSVNTTGTFGYTILGGTTAGGVLEFNKGTVNEATTYNKGLSGAFALVYNGTSDLNIKTKAIIEANGYTYSGGTQINSGRLVWGGSDLAAGKTSQLGTGAISIANGARLYIHFNGSKTSYADRNTISNAFNLNNGSYIWLQDGMYDFTGGINVVGSSTISMNWSKQQVWLRNLSGGQQANLKLFGSTSENLNPGCYIVDSGTSGYLGTITVNGPTGGNAAANHRTELVLLNPTALNSGTVNLLGSAAGPAALVLATETATIGGLDGNTNSKVYRNGTSAGILAYNAPLLKTADTDKPAQLTINSLYGSTFGGSIGDGISLVKSGSGVLKLTGSSTVFNKNLTIKGGSVLLGNADSLGAEGSLGLVVQGQATFGMTTTGSSYRLGSLKLESGSLNISGFGSAGTLEVANNGLTLTKGAGVVMDVGSIQDRLVLNQSIDFTSSGFILGISCFNTKTGAEYTLMNTSGQFSGISGITLDFQSRGADGYLVFGSDGTTIKVHMKTDGYSSELTWNGSAGNNQWVTKGDGSTPWAGSADGDNKFYQNDSVVFGPNGDKNVDIVGNVVPNSIRVTGDGYVFGGTGSIIGKGALYKEGNGDLTIKTNNAYTGGTVISGGRIILDARDGLGTGYITFDGGSLVYGDGVSTDLSDRFYQSNGFINVDLNGNNVTWANANTASYNKTYYISDSAAEGAKGALTISNIEAVGNIVANGKGTDISITSGGTLNSIGGNGNFTTHLNKQLVIDSIGGDSTAGLPAFTGNLTIGSIVGTGTDFSVTLNSGNTADTRFGVNIQASGDTNGLNLSNDMNGKTLYLNKLDGSGTISFVEPLEGSASTTIDLLVTEDTTWNGRVHTTNVENNAHLINLHLSGGQTEEGKPAVFTIGGNNQGYWNVNDANNTYELYAGAGKLTVDKGGYIKFVDTSADNFGIWGGNIVLDASSTVEYAWNFDKNQQAATISGNGTILYTGNATWTLNRSTSFTGTWNLEAGKIVAAKDNVFASGSTVVINGGNLDMGDKLGSSTINWDHGQFTGYKKFKGTLTIDQLPNDSGEYVHNAFQYKLPGFDGSKLTSVNVGVNPDIDEVSIISGIEGDVTLNRNGKGTTRFGVSSKMVGNTVAPPAANAALHVSPGSTVTINGNMTLDLTMEAENTLLNAYLAQPRNEYYIRLVSGALNYTGNTIFNANFGLFNDIYRGTKTMGDGTLQLIFAEETSRLVLHAGNQYRYDITSYGQIDAFTGVTLMGDSVLSINITTPPPTENGLLIRDLEAGSPNALVKTGDSDANANSLITFEKKADQKSVFAGSILGKAQLAKIGDGLFKVGGNVSGTNLTIKEGSMSIGGTLDVSGTTELKGADSELTVQTRMNSTTTILNDTTKLNLNGADNNAGHLTLAGKSSMNLGLGANANVGFLTMGKDSAITVNQGNLTVSGPVNLTGSLQGTGTLTVNDGELTNPENIAAGQFLVDLKSGSSSMIVKSDTMPDLRAVSGTGSIEIQGSTLVISGDGGDFTGDLKGSGVIRKTNTGTQKITGNGNSLLAIEMGDAKDTSNTLILSNAHSTMNFRSLSVGDATNNVSNTLIVEGGLQTPEVSIGKNGILSVGNEKYEGNPYPSLIKGQLSADKLTMERGATISLAMDRAQIDSLATTSSTILNVKEMHLPANGLTKLDLNTLGSQFDWKGSEYTINLMTAESGLTEQSLSQIDVTMSGLLGNKNLEYSVSDVMLKDGKIVQVKVVSSGKNGILHYANSNNSAQAANTLWAARYALNGGTTLSDIIDAVIAADTKYGMTGSQATATLSAFAGSSVTALLGSQHDDLLQQVKWIRNRVAQMGLNPEVSYTEAPYVNAWVQANGGYGKLSSSSDKAGYTMNTWGATLGCDVDLNSHLTLGGALTANHTKLDTESFDSGSGDNDGTYLNLFLRGQKKSWGHTAIVTAGWNDATMNRTLNVPGMDPIHSNGSTSGNSYGIFYEATYDIKVNQEKGTILQPLANIGLYTSKLDGYTESGAGDASLKVDGLDATYGRIGLGARLMGLVGDNIFGREALGEVRLQVVQDFGDETNKATVAPLGMPSVPMNIEGSKVGRTGIQIGAGLAIPVGQQSSVYGDVDCDIRSRQSSVTGNIGFRYTF